MSNSTLTSLAMLKVRVDRGDDYLDYLRPFILQILIDHQINPVTDISVKTYILSDFGMELPARTIQVLLNRFCRERLLKKMNGVYQIAGELPSPRLDGEKANAERHINAVLSGLQNFSKNTICPLSSDNEADIAVRAFLSQFGIQCLRAYLRGTTIPEIKGNYDAQIILVSQYVLELQKKDPDRFESFIILTQGHMLANALLCPDLQSLPKTYNNVTFYLDTPLVIRLLGLEGTVKKDSTNELLNLLSSLGGVVGVFEHTYHEVENVIKSAAKYIDSQNGHSEIVIESRRQGISKSDLLVMIGQIQNNLNGAGVEIIPTPHYNADFQIDEIEFEKIIDEEIRYSNRYAKLYDINSVRSIYVLRRNTSPQSIERCKAVFVTSNAAFARAAFRYGERHVESRETSTVITDFSLANMAWLKAPMRAPSIPMREIIAYSYAAMQPSKAIWDKFLLEVDKLEKQHTISARDHQLLRSCYSVQNELITLTLGEEPALTAETVTEVLARVKSEIKQEENDKLLAEKAAHNQTQKELLTSREEVNLIQQRIYLRSDQKAKWIARVLSTVIILLLVFGLIGGFEFLFNNRILAMIPPLASGVMLLFTIVNLIFGSTVQNFHQFVHHRCRVWFMMREFALLDIDVNANEQKDS